MLSRLELSRLAKADLGTRRWRLATEKPGEAGHHLLLAVARSRDFPGQSIRRTYQQVQRRLIANPMRRLSQARSSETARARATPEPRDRPKAVAPPTWSRAPRPRNSDRAMTDPEARAPPEARDSRAEAPSAHFPCARRCRARCRGCDRSRTRAPRARCRARAPDHCDR